MGTVVADPLVGRLLDGRYEVQRLIAKGGMASVYAAVDIRLDRPVAVKVMHPALAADEDFVSRFRREAKAAARLSSPCIVSVTDQGRDGATVFLVMELVEGRTLREVLRERRRLSPAEALAVLVPVLEALAVAHRAGIVHRDVKPENVLVTDGRLDPPARGRGRAGTAPDLAGCVKVVDFGLARAVDASPLTATAGLLMGTVAYLAPEQVARGIADARADVYAVGVLLFELLTGRPPFSGDSPLQVAYAHLHDDIPRPSSVLPGVPPSLDRLVAAATARDAADRPADAAALLTLVRAAAAGLPEPVVEAAALDDDGGRAGDQDVRATLALPVEQPDVPRPRGRLQRLPRRRRASATSALTEPSAAQSAAQSTAQSTAPLAAGRATSPGPAPAPRGKKRDDGGESGGGPVPPGDTSHRRHHPRRTPLIALVGLVVLALVAGTGWWYVEGRGTPVPRLVGLTPVAAEQAVRDAGLTPRVLPGGAYSETIARGLVVSSDPAPGVRARDGVTVSLRLSLGPERYAVPSLAGLTLEEATRALRVAKLELGQQTRSYSDQVPAGRVISANPASGTLLKPGTPVAIALSEGPAPVTVPDLRGRPADEAQRLLEGLALRVSREQAYSDEVPSGRVIEVRPPGNLRRTDRVTLVVSRGPEFVRLPDVRGERPNRARETLQALGLKVQVLGLDSRVVGMIPGEGSRVRPGSTVTLLAV